MSKVIEINVKDDAPDLHVKGEHVDGVDTLNSLAAHELLSGKSRKVKKEVKVIADRKISIVMPSVYQSIC